MKKTPFLLSGALAAALSFSAAASAATVTLVATLSGANETPAGDADGTGAFSVEVDPDAGDFCYSLSGKNIDKPTMAHVHEGTAGNNGAPVLTIDVTDDECIAAEPDKLKAIVANPAGYYVNIHTAAFPAGAIRGQLSTK